MYPFESRNWRQSDETRKEKKKDKDKDKDKHVRKGMQ